MIAKQNRTSKTSIKTRKAIFYTCSSHDIFRGRMQKLRSQIKPAAMSILDNNLLRAFCDKGFNNGIDFSG
ncbi:hypothetical protein D3C76_1617560 [compost metagenome]